MSERPDITRWLERWQDGDEEAFEELVPLVYRELRILAVRQFQSEGSGHTLQPTALVHEAYVKLMGQDPGRVENRTQFFALAAKAMRQVLVDHARRKAASKRAGDQQRVTLTNALDSSQGGDSSLDALDLHDALRRLAETWNRCADVAAQHGLYVTWEFEPGFAFNKPSDITDVLEAVPKDNFGVMYDTSHGHMVGVVGARQPGEKETLAGGQVELIDRLNGRINHIHLIDSDNTCHKDEQGEDETSMHLPFGDGVVDFEPIVPKLAEQKLPHDWWTIDLCFWPDAWDATARCKTAVDEFVRRWG